MPNFLQNIFEQLQRSASRLVLREIHGDKFDSVTGGEMLALVERARVWLRSTGIQPGERCGLIAANSIHWIAMDLALMAEGIVVVPLYHRQTGFELAAMLKDCQPRLVVSGDLDLAGSLAQAWREVPQPILLQEIFASGTEAPATSPFHQRPDDDL